MVSFNDNCFIIETDAQIGQLVQSIKVCLDVFVTYIFVYEIVQQKEQLIPHLLVVHSNYPAHPSFTIVLSI